uniref:hypothetical protein n=1 Tax=Psychrobacter sp. TaxID=56811 RepID=UPI00159A284C|nr:hypothetical protein [Psychrobacter sp.]QJS05137.1 hypothetical protein [Psychrobacter sp.]
MGKRKNLTSTLKKERRKKKKQSEQRKKLERKKQHILAVSPLEKCFFLCNYKGSVYRFFKEEEHADALARGDVYLSTLDICRAYEDAEQGDSQEAYETYLSGNLSGDGDDHEFVEKARRSGIGIGPGSRDIKIINCSNTVSLPDAYVLCTTTEFLPENLNEKFGKYCVEIKDPRKFFVAVSKKINSISAIREAAIREIIYADRNYTGMEQTPGPIGFVKPSTPYKKQKEFRFLWLMENMGQLNPPLLKCPEVSSLCRRIA